MNKISKSLQKLVHSQVRKTLQTSTFLHSLQHHINVSDEVKHGHNASIIE